MSVGKHFFFSVAKCVNAYVTPGTSSGVEIRCRQNVLTHTLHEALLRGWRLDADKSYAIVTKYMYLYQLYHPVFGAGDWL